MTRRKMRNPLKITGYILLAVLIVVLAFMGADIINLSQRTMLEAQTTPTPAPTARNVMQVTIDPNQPTPEPVLRSGAQGEAVTQVQSRLQVLGYYTGAIDGQYGNGTREAVRLFQEQNGLGTDGIVGSQTRSVLFSVEAKPVTITPAPTMDPTPVPTTEPVPGVDANGMPMLVNRSHHLPDGYQPVHLVNLTEYCDSSIVTIKGNGIEGEKVAVDALMEMLRAAHEADITVWQVSAGWRSVSYQQQLYDRKVNEYKEQGFSTSKAKSAASRTVADPGASEHHTGLAFDITVPGTSFKGTRQANWLAANCWNYGFIIRYEEDKKDITGFEAEPWHIRYVGIDHSITMWEEGLCL